MRVEIKSYDTKYDAELAALGSTDTKVDIDNEELFDKVLNLISEKSYEDGRVAGNYVDLIKDYFQYGKKPVFDEKIISKKAYDELFNDDTGYIVQLDKKFKDEGYYIVGNNLVVWDSNIVTGEGKKDRIAGEIDLIVVDKKGNAFIIDIKTGSRSKWTNFNQPTLSFDNKKYSKRNEYTLQQAVYRELLKRQTGVETAIGLLPIERESDKETDQIISAKKPLAAGLAKEVIYEFDDEGKVKKNKFKDPKGDKDFEEKRFKPGPNNAINDVFIPLSLESVAEEIDDLLKTKDNSVPLSDEVKEEFVSPIEVNSRYFKNNKDYTQVTVMKVDGDKITIKGNRKNSKETIVSTKDLLNKELYLTSEDIDKLKSEESNYESSESEETILKESQDTVGDFIKDTELTNNSYSALQKGTKKKNEDDLLTEIKNCQ
jgi:hypothetical protein